MSAAGFGKLFRDIARDFNRLCDGPALRDEPRNVVGSRQIDALRQLFDMKVDPVFHNLLELSSLERRNVRARELEPFAVYSPVRKTAMPVGFDPFWVVGADRMNELSLLR